MQRIETPAQAKIRSLFTKDSLEKIERQGLMIIDKSDFEAQTRMYNQREAEIRELKIQIRQLQARLGRK